MGLNGLQALHRRVKMPQIYFEIFTAWSTFSSVPYWWFHSLLLGKSIPTAGSLHWIWVEKLWQWSLGRWHQAIQPLERHLLLSSVCCRDQFQKLEIFWLCFISRSTALDRQMSVVGVGVCLSSAVSKTADIMTLSVSFRYGKWVVPLILLLWLLDY